MGLRVKYPSFKDPEVIAEREAFYKEWTAYRKFHKEEYKRLVDIENKKYHNPEAEHLPIQASAMLEAHRRRLTRERNSIIKVAMHTKNMMHNLIKKDIENKEKQKWHNIEDMKKLRERQMYLNALQIDHSAPVPPPTIIDHGQYYERLQNLAFLSQQGLYEEVEKSLNNKEVVDEKNHYLQPLYRTLRHCIRFITKTEEASLITKYRQKMHAVVHSKIENPKPELDKIQNEFKQKLTELRAAEKEPGVMLKKMERHITSLFHLLMTWIQYTDIIYASENTIQQLKFLRLNQTEGEKVEERMQKEYLKKILRDQKAEEETKYQTVEEGATSDTGDSADENLDSAEPATTPIVEQSKPKEFNEEEGLLNQLMAEDEDIQDQESIKSFGGVKTIKDKEEDIDYGIGAADLAAFKLKVQAKGNIQEPSEIHTKQEEEFAMSNLGMFGVAQNEEDTSRYQQDEENIKYVEDQIKRIVENYGQDLQARDSELAPHSGIDPYFPPENITKKIIDNEISGTYSTSLVLEVLSDKLSALDDSTLSKDQLSTKDKLKQLLEYMSRIKVVDGPVLSEIYELYRYK